MKKYLTGLFFVALVTVAVVPTSARAETTSSSVSGMLELLQTLMKQVEALQKQLAELKGDISEEIRDGLKEGMTNDDIRKIQELLATDPEIYPKGLASGYYGPLTKDAVKKFQKRHDLAETGVVDAETKKLMQEYFKERTNGKFPPGLLRAPGIDKKIKDRMRERDGKWELDCDDKKAAGPLCKDSDDDDDDDDEDEDEDEREDEDDEDEDEREDDDEDNDEDDSNNIGEVEAKTSIKKAYSSIISLKAAIAESSDARAIEDAKDELEDARDEYDDAQEDFKDDDFDSAYENAVEADKIAKQAIEELLEDDETIASSTALRAINDAKAAIEELDDAIDDTDLDDDSSAVEEVDDALDDAKDELEDAEDDYEDLEFRKAYDSAVKSEQIAEKALSDLKKAENNLL